MWTHTGIEATVNCRPINAGRNEMPECKKCEGSGSIVIIPFYKAPDGSGEVKRCDVCDGYGRVTEAGDATDWSLMGPLYRCRIIELEARVAELEAALSPGKKD
jgi:hypothetical protein